MPASIGEFLDGHEEITSENGFVSLENYSKFWNNLILSDDSVSYFVTISITQLMYLLGGLHRVCPFPGFLTKVCCNPDPLPNNYTKLCKEAEVHILSLISLLDFSVPSPAFLFSFILILTRDM